MSAPSKSMVAQSFPKGSSSTLRCDQPLITPIAIRIIEPSPQTSIFSDLSDIITPPFYGVSERRVLQVGML
jgi:hypothetical protein